MSDPEETCGEVPPQGVKRVHSCPPERPLVQPQDSPMASQDPTASSGDVPAPLLCNLAAGVDGSSPKRVKTTHDGTLYRLSSSDLQQTAGQPSFDINERLGRPRLAVYHPSFAKAEQDVTSVCDRFIQFYTDLRNHGYCNQAIEYVCKDLETFRVPAAHYPEHGPATCLGPAGVGKSSTVNCLLSQKMVAPEHDGDERGTWVAHEYTSRHAKQLQKYRVEVPYLSAISIQALIGKHHSNIVKYLRQSQDDLDVAEEDDLDDKYETAKGFFRDMLCNTTEFESVEATVGFFSDRLKDEPSNVRQDLWEMVQCVLAGRNIDRDGNEVHAASDERGLNQILKQVSRPAIFNGQQHPSPWPLVTKIQIRQDVDLLNSGLVLADTAGVNDTNLTVMENTESYLSNAGAILVFANMKRISKSAELDKLLRRCISLGKIDRTYLVVTTIDDKNDFSQIELDTLDHVNKDRIDLAEADIKSLEQELRQTTIEQENERDDSRYRSLNQRLKSLKREFDQAKASRKQLTVEIHCRNVERKLDDKLQKLGKSKTAPKLKVFFVSNTQYQKHMRPNNDQDPPILDLEATGIPKLRRFLYSMPAVGKFDVLRNIGQARLPNIFNGINAILTKSTLERKKDVQKLLAVNLRSQATITPTIVGKIQEAFENRITGCIGSNQAAWIHNATALLEVWARDCKKNFAAFCRKSGTFRLVTAKGQGKPKELSWNDLIRAISDAQLIEAFDELDNDIVCVERWLSTKLDDAFRKLQEEIEACEAAQGIPMGSFFLFVSDCKTHLAHEIEKKLAVIKKDLSRIRANAVIDGPTTYVASAMQKTYEECTKMGQVNYHGDADQPRRQVKKKTNITARRIEVIRDRLTGASDQISVFKAVGQLASNELAQSLKVYQVASEAIVINAKDRILRDFDSRYQDSVIKVEENPVAIAKLQGAAQDAMDIINGPMKKHLDECADYENSAP